MCLFQDYEERIASLQEQVERNSMMSSMIRFDVELDDDECKSLFSLSLYYALLWHYTLSKALSDTYV